MEYSENENIFIDKKNTQINLFFINFYLFFIQLIDWFLKSIQRNFLHKNCDFCR